MIEIFTGSIVTDRTFRVTFFLPGFIAYTQHIGAQKKNYYVSSVSTRLFQVVNLADANPSHLSGLGTGTESSWAADFSASIIQVIVQGLRSTGAVEVSRGRFSKGGYNSSDTVLQ